MKYTRELRFINDSILSAKRNLSCVGLKSLIEFGNNQLTVVVTGNGKASRCESCETYDICTWRAAWRICRGGEIVIGSRDVFSEEEFNVKLRALDMGRLESIDMITDWDILIRFANNFTIEFLSLHSDDDSIFDIFTPNEQVVSFSPAYGWQIGESNKPWSGENVKPLLGN